MFLRDFTHMHVLFYLKMGITVFLQSDKQTGSVIYNVDFISTKSMRDLLSSAFFRVKIIERKYNLGNLKVQILQHQQCCSHN